MISNGPESMGKMMISTMELMLNFHTKPSDFGWGESSGSCKSSTSPQSSAVQMDNKGQEMEWRVLTRWFLQQAPTQPRHSKPVTVRCGVRRATKFECLDARKFDSWTQEGNKKIIRRSNAQTFGSGLTVICPEIHEPMLHLCNLRTAAKLRETMWCAPVMFVAL